VNYSRVATTKNGIAIESKDQKISILIGKDDLTFHDTAEKLLAEAEKQAKSSLTGLYFHVNRDGSVAIATGEKSPEKWPEDEAGEIAQNG